MIVSELCIYPIKACQGIKLATVEVTKKGLLWDRELMLVSQKGKFLTQRQFPQLAKVKITLENQSLNLAVSDPSLGLEPITFTPTFDGPEMEVNVWQDSTVAIDQGDRLAEWFHRVLELDETKQCRLVRQSPNYKRQVRHKVNLDQKSTVSFADGYPCLLTTTASLAELNRRIKDTYEDDEIQPVSMDRFRANIVIESDLAFDEDSWRTIEIGNLRFAVVKPCSRCIMVTVDQNSGKINELKEPLRTLGTFRQFGDQGVMFGENIIPYDSGRISVGDKLEIVSVR